jgi:hypothetical protein
MRNAIPISTAILRERSIAALRVPVQGFKPLDGTAGAERMNAIEPVGERADA